MSEKNYTKYESYKFAFDQIDLAIEKGFYLEAITIEESILADRLISFLQMNGKKVNSKFTLGGCFDPLKHFDCDFSIKDNEDFRVELDHWWDKRNECLHAIVKSNRGDPTIEVEEFLEISRATALQGKFLSRRIADWVKSQKRRIEREIKTNE